MSSSECVGFLIAVDEVSVLGCDAVNLSTLQDESSTFSRNVENQVPRTAVSFPRRTDASTVIYCVLDGGKNRILDFKLSPCFECSIITFG